MKYILIDGTIINEEEFNTIMANGDGQAWKMAFVGCTYHCG